MSLPHLEENYEPPVTALLGDVLSDHYRETACMLSSWILWTRQAKNFCFL